MRRIAQKVLSGVSPKTSENSKGNNTVASWFSEEETSENQLATVLLPLLRFYQELYNIKFLFADEVPTTIVLRRAGNGDQDEREFSLGLGGEKVSSFGGSSRGPPLANGRRRAPPERSAEQRRPSDFPYWARFLRTSAQVQASVRVLAIPREEISTLGMVPPANSRTRSSSKKIFHTLVVPHDDRLDGAPAASSAKSFGNDEDTSTSDTDETSCALAAPFAQLLLVHQSREALQWIEAARRNGLDVLQSTPHTRMRSLWLAKKTENILRNNFSENVDRVGAVDHVVAEDPDPLFSRLWDYADVGKLFRLCPMVSFLHRAWVALAPSYGSRTAVAETLGPYWNHMGFRRRAARTALHLMFEGRGAGGSARRAGAELRKQGEALLDDKDGFGRKWDAEQTGPTTWWAELRDFGYVVRINMSSTCVGTELVAMTGCLGRGGGGEGDNGGGGGCRW